MKAVVTKADLSAGIMRAAGALPVRPSSMQILQNILLSFEEKQKAIRAIATDLEIAAIVEIPATIKEAGALTVPGKKLVEALRQLPDGEISLTATERHALTLKAGKARLTIRGTSKDDYPALPVVSDKAGNVSFQIPGAVSIAISAEAWKDAIRKTIIGASRDETRTFLTGANLVIGKTAQLVATDGHRLAITDFSLAESGKDTAVNVIIPHRVLNELASNLPSTGNVRVQVGQTQIAFSSDTGIHYSRLIAEKFPDYEKIVPKGSDHKIRMKRQEFVDALRCVSPFANVRTSAVLLSIKSDKVVVSAETPEFGEGIAEVDAEVKGSTFDISFNSQYLMEGLKVLSGEELSFEAGAKIAPAVMTTKDDPDYKYILMPLRQ